jgi:hypothetical protein
VQIAGPRSERRSTQTMSPGVQAYNSEGLRGRALLSRFDTLGTGVAVQNICATTDFMDVRHIHENDALLFRTCDL